MYLAIFSTQNSPRDIFKSILLCATFSKNYGEIFELKNAPMFPIPDISKDAFKTLHTVCWYHRFHRKTTVSILQLTKNSFWGRYSGIPSWPAYNDPTVASTQLIVGRIKQIYSQTFKWGLINFSLWLYSGLFEEENGKKI